MKLEIDALDPPPGVRHAGKVVSSGALAASWSRRGCSNPPKSPARAPARGVGIPARALVPSSGFAALRDQHVEAPRSRASSAAATTSRESAGHAERCSADHGQEWGTARARLRCATSRQGRAWSVPRAQVDLCATSQLRVLRWESLL